MTWRLRLGLGLRLAANDLDHKSESQVAKKTKSLYNLSFDISIKYNFSILFNTLIFFLALCDYSLKKFNLFMKRDLTCPFELGT